jgi:hypothetical protein
MAFRKIGENDFFLNTMKAQPHNKFFIFDTYVYYNNESLVPDAPGNRNVGSQAHTVKNVPRGFVSLYEYNIDRPLSGNVGRPNWANRNIASADRTPPDTGPTHVAAVIEGPVAFGYPGGAMGLHSPASYTDLKAAYDADTEPITFLPNNGTIYAYISKDSARSSFKTVTPVSYNNEYAYGAVQSFQYPLSSSITREYITTPSSSTGTYNRHYVALRNRLNFYGARSQQYIVKGPTWDKDTQTLNMIHIPSIFYGTKIEPGTVSLKFYWTGSLVAELRDDRRNGELIQQSDTDDGTGALGYSGSCAGVVMYDEGIVILTGSWDMNYQSARLIDGTDRKPKWIYWGVGANDGTEKGSGGINATFANVSFDMSFKGNTETQVMTLFAHARRGEANYSNNPTFLKFGQEKVNYTSSHVYQENPNLLMKNTVSSSFGTTNNFDYTSSFERQVYISRIGVYDKSKNLIGLATLSNPILKKEDQNYTFKLKMDV